MNDTSMNHDYQPGLLLFQCEHFVMTKEQVEGARFFVKIKGVTLLARCPKDDREREVAVSFDGLTDKQRRDKWGDK